MAKSDRSLSIELSNHLQWLTEFVLTISDSRINLIIELNFTGKSVAIFTEQTCNFWLKKVTVGLFYHKLFSPMSNFLCQIF